MNIPKIFYELSNRANKAEKITPEEIELYVVALKEDTTFLPEVIAITGVDIFLELVTKLGGQRIFFPTPEKMCKDIAVIKKEGESS